MAVTQRDTINIRRATPQGHPARRRVRHIGIAWPNRSAAGSRERCGQIAPRPSGSASRHPAVSKRHLGSGRKIN